MFSTITTGKEKNYPCLWYSVPYMREDAYRNHRESWGTQSPSYFSGNCRYDGNQESYREKPPIILHCLPDVIPMLVAVGETDNEIAYITRLAKLDSRYAQSHQ